MARVILEAEGEDVTVGGTDVDVIGTTASGEVVTVVSGSVTLDASFTQGGDTIQLSGEAEAYTATIVGSRIILSNGTSSVSIPLSTNANAIVFGGDDTRVLVINGDGDVSLGGQIVATGGGSTTLEPGNEDGSINASLEALQDAETALDAFEEDQGMTGDDARADLALAVDALADARDIRTDAQLQADLTAANADLDAAQDDVDAVVGLQAAIDAEADAQAELDDATADEVTAQARIDAEAVFFDSANPDVADVVVNADGTVTATVDGVANTQVIVLNVDGDLEIADGINETGTAALLEASIANEAAEDRLEVAIDAEAEAQADLDLTDQVVTADDERDNVEDFAAAEADFRADLAAFEADPDAGSAAAVEASFDVLVTLGLDDAGLDTDLDGNVEASEIDAQQVEINTRIATREGELADLLLAAEVSNPRTTDLEIAAEAQADAQSDVTDREDLINAVVEAQATVDAFEELEADVDAAIDAIVELGFEEPVNVEGADETATAGSDVFIFVENDGEIDGFGDSGSDILFVGEGFTQVNLTDEDINNDSVGAVGTLEIFVQQDGADTILFIEDATFAGNVGDGSFSGSTIVLTGVDADDVSVNADGTVTIETATAATFAPETFA